MTLRQLIESAVKYRMMQTEALRALGEGESMATMLDSELQRATKLAHEFVSNLYTGEA
jgi:hypothetical protein